jgi:predicted RNase H-like nuclease (RuvC/YqgF family)
MSERIIKLTGPIRIKPKPLTPHEMTQEQRQWKIQSLKEHIDQLEEALWYAKQDVAQFTLKLDISHATKRMEAERAMEDTEKEISDLKREISELNAV